MIAQAKLLQAEAADLERDRAQVTVGLRSTEGAREPGFFMRDRKTLR
jgi:hypothetical protein